MSRREAGPFIDVALELARKAQAHVRVTALSEDNLDIPLFNMLTDIVHRLTEARSALREGDTP